MARLRHLSAHLTPPARQPPSSRVHANPSRVGRKNGKQGEGMETHFLSLFAAGIEGASPVQKAQVERETKIAPTPCQAPGRSISKKCRRRSMRCPKCGRVIPPAEVRRVDFERIECPVCGERFVPRLSASIAPYHVVRLHLISQRVGTDINLTRTSAFTISTRDGFALAVR